MHFTEPNPLEVEEVRRMIGKPWSEDGLGPYSFHCWGVIHYLYSKFLDVNLNAYSDVDATNHEDVKDAISNVSNLSDWEEIPEPVHFCGVALGRNKSFHHVGLFLSWDSGYVLHSSEGGCVSAHTIQSMRVAWPNIKFYKYRKNG